MLIYTGKGLFENKRSQAKKISGDGFAYLHNFLEFYGDNVYHPQSSKTHDTGDRMPS